jgi:hypothetical protein
MTSLSSGKKLQQNIKLLFARKTFFENYQALAALDSKFKGAIYQFWIEYVVQLCTNVWARST